MRPQAKLLLVEGAIAPGDEPDAQKFGDLEMPVLTPDDKERTEGEFEELYGKAGFRLTRVIPPQSPFQYHRGSARVASEYQITFTVQKGNNFWILKIEQKLDTGAYHFMR